MNKIPAVLTSINNVIQQHPVCFTNGLLIALSTGGERLFSIAFICPQDAYLRLWYGWLFLLVPFFILAFLGCVLNKQCWRTCHGCNNFPITTKACCSSLMLSFSQSLVIPCTWLFVALLDGDYVACSMCGSDSETEDVQVLPSYKYWKSVSQMTGWGFLGAIFTIASLITCVSRCLSNRTALESHCKSIYRIQEQQELEERMKKTTKALAGRCVDHLFRSGIPERKTWQEIVEIKLSPEERGYKEKLNQADICFSPLHYWITKEIEKDPNLVPLLQPQKTGQQIGTAQPTNASEVLTKANENTSSV